jgi:hypothetical protein
MSVYHSQTICSGPSVSSGGLRKIFRESPAHFYAEWDGNPKRKERETPAQFILGQAVHHLMLGEPGFAKLFAVQPTDYENEKTGEVKPWTYQAKVCKDWREARLAEGKQILTAQMVEDIRGMATALASHPLVKAGAFNGEPERSLIWQDKETGIWLKSRPDNIPIASGDFIDLKTTTSVLYEDMVKTIGNFHYHCQGALVRRAAREVMGIREFSFTLFFVEKTDPYCVDVVMLKDNDLDRGAIQNQFALRIMANCLKAGKWPGPGADRADARYIELSEREQKYIDDKLETMKGELQ